MKAVLLDTDIVSFLFKDERDRIEMIEPHLVKHVLAISFMTVAELYQWAGFNKWGSARLRRLEASIRDYLVLPFDIEVCRLWASIRAERRFIGRPISPQDAWIAATALQHDLSLITNNVSDFEGITDLKLIGVRSDPA